MNFSQILIFSNNEKARPRQSNMELLRLIAMMLVLIMHCLYNPMPIPDYPEWTHSFGSSFLRMFGVGLSWVAVDCFVLLSGWLGLRLTFKGFVNILFQCLFYAILSIIGASFFMPSVLHFSTIIKILYPGAGYWFVAPYLGLMLLSPLLNLFVEKMPRKSLRNYIFLFYGFQMIFGYCFLDSALFGNGISILSFCGLYLIARFFSLYPTRFSNLSPIVYIIIYILMGSLFAMIHYVFTTEEMSIVQINIIDKMHANSNPIVIVGAMCLLLAFANFNMRYSSAINWLAKSSFAIYLMHCNPITFPIFLSSMLRMSLNYYGIEYGIFVVVVILGISIISILVDKIRLCLWNQIVEKYKL